MISLTFFVYLLKIENNSTFFLSILFLSIDILFSLYRKKSKINSELCKQISCVFRRSAAKGWRSPTWGGATTDCAYATREGTGRDGRGLNDRRAPPWAFRPEREQPYRPWQRGYRPEWACPRDYHPCPKDCRPCRREREQPCHPSRRGCRPEWAYPRGCHPCLKDCRPYLRGSCREAWCRVDSCRHPSSFCRAGRSSPRGL